MFILSLTLTISKSKQNKFQSDDDYSNEQSQDNRHDDRYQIVGYPDGRLFVQVKNRSISFDTSTVGEIEIVDSEKLLSFEKKTCRSKRTRASRVLTFTDFSKIMNINTIYLVLRRVRYLDRQKRYLTDSNVVFRSNPFRPGRFQKGIVLYFSFALQLVRV